MRKSAITKEILRRIVSAELRSFLSPPFTVGRGVILSPALQTLPTDSPSQLEILKAQGG